ncbi:MAG: L-seryl-tRNA(Sec) selenium transferase [Acidobacteria bacterium]|nr:L-seryl-tRNA(Sec) selenium transferase [Acidobacteriota bacterium]
MSSLYRQLPAVHRLLDTPELAGAIARHGQAAVVAACQRALDGLRASIGSGEITAGSFEHACTGLPAAIAAALDAPANEPYIGVINATGVLIHTNLGRSPLASPVPSSLGGYLALELDLETGGRGQRLAPIRRRLADVFGIEDAVMVNNNAAAVLLMLTAHAAGRSVIVSRSQLIEIGGSFRLPDVMAASGAHLVEVGCTNRTHLADYANAIGEDTAAILVAHRSNYRIIGFTAEPGLGELAALAHERGLPLFVDQGSGAIHDLARWGLPHEPTVPEILDEGADIVCFSGDKLLGGPQAGILAGKRAWIEPLGRHPLFRALRPGKTTLAWMDAVLAAHRAGRLDDVPLYAMLGTPLPALRRRARRLVKRLAEAGITARASATEATLGGGTAPGAVIPSWGLRIPGDQRLAAALRTVRPPVIGHIENGEIVLDLRTVFPSQDTDLAQSIIAASHSFVTPSDEEKP